MKRDQRIEAIHIVAAGIDANQKKGTPAYAEAKAFERQLVRIWRQQLYEKKRCPQCNSVIS